MKKYMDNREETVNDLKDLSVHKGWEVLVSYLSRDIKNIEQSIFETEDMSVATLNRQKDMRKLLIALSELPANVIKSLEVEDVEEQDFDIYG